MLLILGLTVITHGSRLPGLIKGLKVEDVDAPSQHAAHALGIVLGSPGGARLGHPIRRPAIRRPPGLTVPDLDRGRRARELLDAVDGLGQVVEVDVVRTGGLVDGLVLPVRERVDEQDVDVALDEGVGRAVGVLVPRVGRADFDFGGETGFDGVDFGEEFGAGEVAPVERLGADGDGVEGGGVLVAVLLDGRVVGREG